MNKYQLPNNRREWKTLYMIDYIPQRSWKGCAFQLAINHFGYQCYFYLFAPTRLRGPKKKMRLGEYVKPKMKKKMNEKKKMANLISACNQSVCSRLGNIYSNNESQQQQYLAKIIA